MRLWPVWLVLALTWGLDARAAKDTAFYRYNDGGADIIVQGRDQVPRHLRLWADKVVVGEHYGGKAPPKPPAPSPPVVAAPTVGSPAASPCAPAASVPWWRSMIPKDPVRRWLSIISLVASVGLAIWLFRAIKFVVWLRALITMFPVFFVVGVLWMFADRMTATRARIANNCGPAGPRDLTDKLLDAHTDHLKAMDKAIEQETGTGKR